MESKDIGMDLEKLRNTCDQFRKLFDEHHQEMPEKHLKEHFPRGCCKEVSNTLGLYLKVNGFGIWNSVYAKEMLNGNEESHVWLQKGDTICDLTLDQFGKEYPKVFVGNKQTFHSVFYEQKPKQYSLGDLEREVYAILEKYMV